MPVNLLPSGESPERVAFSRGKTADFFTSAIVT